jgi:alpha-N-arabinofuranosidase
MFEAGTYTHGEISMPRVDAIAARDTAGKLWLEITNVNPNEPLDVQVSVVGANLRSATGQTLTAARVDSVNRFDAPNTVMPKPISGKIQTSKLSLTLEPKSVTVVSLEQ